MEEKKRGNPLWKAGMKAVPGSGRPRGSKADALKRLRRWYNRRGTERELDAIYDHLESAKEQADFMRSVWFYLLPRPTNESISPEEVEALYNDRVKLEKRIIQLENELKNVSQKEAS
jgi:hypothetical protein